MKNHGTGWTRLARCRLLALTAVVILGGCAGAWNLPASPRPQSYVVRPGDTLYSIAWHYGLDYYRVARWNDVPPPYTIHSGERIYLYPRKNSSARETPRKTAARKAGKSHSTRRVRQDSDTASASTHRKVHWRWPAAGTLRDTFGANTIAGKGIVIGGQLGEPVRAAAGGTVVYAGDALVGYGRLVIIKHNEEWLSAYAHNQRLLVHEGQTVKAGDEIATMGVTPDGKSALYFQIRKDGSPVDPLRFLPRRR